MSQGEHVNKAYHSSAQQKHFDITEYRPLKNVGMNYYVNSMQV